jgi:hypothetical protein
MNDGILVTINYGQHLLGELGIYPTYDAESAWEVFKKHPNMYHIEPEYIKHDDGTLELIGLSLVTRPRDIRDEED